jgi:hypothetical protein
MRFKMANLASIFAGFLVVAALLFCGCTDTKKKVATGTGGVPLINNEGIVAFDSVPDSFEKVSEGLYRSKLTAATSIGGETKFTRLTGTGIHYRNEFSRERSVLLIETGSGVAIADYDNDGLKDIYLTGTDIDNRLYKNLGNFKFEDVTFEAKVDGRIGDKNIYASGASFADIDNDGDLDLYVCNMAAPNILYINQNDGTFREQTIHRGANYAGASKQASFCDFDRDGDLDFYLATYQDRMVSGNESTVYIDGKLHVREGYNEYATVINGYDSKAGEQDILFENQGDGTFKKRGKDIGISGWDANLATVWFDYDNDGWQDIYVTSDFKQPDHLYRNNHDGTFTDVLKDTVRKTPWFAMGVDAGDLNNDGYLDLMVGDMADPDHYGQKVNMGDMSESGWFLVWGAPRQFMQNCTFINSGDGRLMDHAAITGMAKTDWTWAIRMVDLDNDGKLDVYVTNGHARDNMNGDLSIEYREAQKKGLTPEQKVAMFAKVPARKDTNMVFQNKGDLEFESKGPQWGLDHKGVSHSASFADLDGDGDLDAIVNNYYEPASIYRNDSDQGSRLLVQLRSKDGNHFGVGSKVEIWQNGNYQRRDLIPSRGYLGSDPMELHFGLSEDTNVKKLKVTWPDGTSEDFADLEVNHVYRIIESSDRTPEASHEPIKPLFANATKSFGISFRHKENEYDDFKREPLLPYQLSRLGGGVVSGDVNGDGFVDVFCSGAAGQSSQLLINEGGKSFKPVNGPWAIHSASEDMGALFFDADQDGDADLYVASGGTEFDIDSAEYRDRLYLNDGSGQFKFAENWLPDLADSSSSVSAADFDRDGDLDLFVGSRSIPGKYPLIPNSRLLINDNGKFTDATADTTGGATTKGLVSSAIWSDFNNDGWVDLILALEWGPVAFFQNNAGKLVDATGDSGVDENTGWWHGIAAGDLDADGDMDYVVTNQGTNTKYHTSPEHPHRLYYDDFDQNGSLDLVEAEYEGETEYPVRGRSCSSRCMPFIADKFGSFHDFSKASLADIYETDTKERPFHEVATLESVVLWNDGEGFFDAKPLGYLAQSSPAYGAAIGDFDGDSKLDIMLTNNFFGAQPETGYMDGGLSLLIKGNGDQTFEEVWPSRSGISLSGDSNGLAIADLDRDGDLDAMVAVNDEPFEILRNESGAKRGVSIELIGAKGNPDAIGASILLAGSFGKQRFENHAGGSYLAQSSFQHAIAAEKLGGLKSITVRWPNGTETVCKPTDVNDGKLRVEQIKPL